MRAKGVTEPAGTPSVAARRSGAPNEKRGAPIWRESVEVDAKLLAQNDEPETILLVLQKKILGVTAPQAAPKRARLLDGEDGRMSMRRPANAELVEAPVEFAFALVGRGKLAAQFRASGLL